MSKAYLTIDDSPTKLTPGIVDFLCEKGICPVLNLIGQNIENYMEETIYAIQKGAIIGNHGFTHTAFSTLTIEECRTEIQKTEDAINLAYKNAGVERNVRVFRFPYGDKGGELYDEIQKMLHDEFGFWRIDSSEVLFYWWKENHLDTDIDMKWTFDFEEYRLSWNDGFTWDTIMKHIDNPNPEQGGALLGEEAVNIVLIHDHELTNEIVPDYFQKLINRVCDAGVVFEEPRFL